MSNNIKINLAGSAVETLRTNYNSTTGIETIAVDLNAAPAQHVDAFSRLRVSSPGYRFDSQLTYGIDADLWDIKETGDGSVDYDTTNRSASLTAGQAAGANTAILQSRYHAPYTPGRGQLVFITFSVQSETPANGEVGVGYYDGANGIYLKQTATELTLNLENTTSAPNANVLQADWNIDPLDGTGPSGFTLDVTKTNILVIQLQALYVGRVVVGFDIGGNLIPVHAFENANIADHPYIAQASLPIRYWASTEDDDAESIIRAICSSVISEGGDNLENISGRQFAASGTLTDADPKIAVMVIRPKEQFNSINQNALVIPTEVAVSAVAAGCWIEVRRNATVSAGDFTDVAATSVVECSFAGNTGTDPAADGATGTLIDKFYLPAAATPRVADSSGLSG